MVKSNFPTDRSLSYRFSKSERLLTPQDFNFLKSQSQKFKSSALMVFYRPSRKSLPHGRLGLSVSKKVGKAHRRNRIKRLIREFYRHSNLRECPVDMMLVVSSRIDRHANGERYSESQLLSSLQKFEAYLKRRL